MVSDRTGAVEEFLVEHVMLGLGNIRTALDRIGPGTDREMLALAQRRIEGRIDDIEARARSLLDLLARSGAPGGAAPAVVHPADAGLLAAAGPAPAETAVFASRRAT